MTDTESRPVTLSEVKSILSKVSKDREEMLYEQKIALEHAQKFAKIPVSKSKKMVKELSDIDVVQEIHAYKIADILPTTEDDVKTIFAKERITLSKSDIDKILETVNKYYIE